MADEREGMDDKEGRYRGSVVENAGDGDFVLASGSGKIEDGVVESPESISPAAAAGARTRRISWRRNLLTKLKSIIGSGTMTTAMGMARVKVKATTAVSAPTGSDRNESRGRGDTPDTKARHVHIGLD